MMMGLMSNYARNSVKEAQQQQQRRHQNNKHHWMTDWFASMECINVLFSGHFVVRWHKSQAVVVFNGILASFSRFPPTYSIPLSMFHIPIEHLLCAHDDDAFSFSIHSFNFPSIFFCICTFLLCLPQNRSNLIFFLLKKWNKKCMNGIGAVACQMG